MHFTTRDHDRSVTTRPVYAFPSIAYMQAVELYLVWRGKQRYYNVSDAIGLNPNRSSWRLSLITDLLYRGRVNSAGGG